MEELLGPRAGHRLLQILIVLLVLGGAIFLWKFTAHHRELNPRESDSRLLLLDRAYQLRREELSRYYDRKIKQAPDEVISMRYQQEKNIKLEEVQNRYFRDKEDLRRGEGKNWRRHWTAQINFIETKQDHDDSPDF